MPRRRSPEKRKVLPDPKYKDVVLAKFMNNLMKDGKKSVAEKIVYGAFDEINKNSKEDPNDPPPSQTSSTKTISFLSTPNCSVINL